VIGYRSFGENKEKVAHLLEYLRGMNDMQAFLGCLKHFPGHAIQCRFHLITHFKETLEQLLENELYPFIKGIESDD
jgi:beta-glucosidase-like glycosyl hydrolase